MTRCDAIGRTVLQILCVVDLLYAQLLKGKNFEMIRLAVATIALIALMSACAFAQDSAPKVQVFGGYSFVHVDNGGLSPNTLYAALHEPNNHSRSVPTLMAGTRRRSTTSPA